VGHTTRGMNPTTILNEGYDFLVVLSNPECPRHILLG
jgi:hypothetical protein